MRRCVLSCVLVLVALPLWAGYGLSNVVKKEIHRGPVIEEIPVEQADRPAGQTAAPAAAPAKTTYYPYTIHLSSWQDQKEATRQIEKMRSRLDPVYLTKIDLGASGLWYRIDYGLFPTIKEAVARLRELKAKNIIDKGAFVGGEVAFAIEIGAYESMQEAKDEAQELIDQGIVPYIVKESDSLFRLLAGAYPDEKSAAPAVSDLNALGYSPALKKR
ncbi:MAG: Sporulation related domain protein [Deltaproteobacteria bacterium ADurb.BinA179]|jgi:septal ring-binding cell division protein DamX|nr:SPOR domain-containing protein [Bacteriovoracaceae bacterium]OPZ25875.1 MAG: Sporulation related domain protein [Deltaproteobacteria bacterium ADurb.BinA179]HNR52146.1 SPOR domain-containing protein [Deltaproteobacteria bacterium]HNU74164.1 SPOR domain-containing protein [Deltaproteobacteria bacterium]HOD71534.1 SPOR domain-containing protein [Deltaproteobacteria bacterium]